METVDLKSALHRFIDQIQDASVLEAVHTLLAKQLSAETDFWNGVSAERKEDIEAGIEDLEAGKAKKFEEVLRKYQ